MKMSSKIFTWHFHLKSSFSDFSKFSCFLKFSFFRKSFFSMMKKYFLFRFFSVIKYVSLVTPETIQNTRRALTMTLNPQLDPNCWRKLVKFPRFSFCNYVCTQELSIVYVKIWGCLSSNGPSSELKRSWQVKRLQVHTNKNPYCPLRTFLEPQEASKHDFQTQLRFFCIFKDCAPPTL